MRLFSYVVARDYGFAPNPFHRHCTLATCKPGIRARAAVGDWVIGTGAKTKYRLEGHLTGETSCAIPHAPGRRRCNAARTHAGA
jgi:hypothetical protein